MVVLFFPLRVYYFPGRQPHDLDAMLTKRLVLVANERNTAAVDVGLTNIRHPAALKITCRMPFFNLFLNISHIKKWRVAKRSPKNFLFTKFEYLISDV